MFLNVRTGSYVMAVIRMLQPTHAACVSLAVCDGARGGAVCQCESVKAKVLMGSFRQELCPGHPTVELPQYSCCVGIVFVTVRSPISEAVQSSSTYMCVQSQPLQNM